LVFGRNTFSLNLYNFSLKLTSATVASATSNSMPDVTFCLALLLRLEVVKLRSSSGIAKLAGVSLCLAGVFAIAFYAGPALSPVNHHRAFAAHAASTSRRVTWIKGTFFMVLSNATWSLWIVMQAGLLKEYPNKMLVTVTQCVAVTHRCSGGREGLLQVEAPARRQLARYHLHSKQQLISIHVSTANSKSSNQK
jgi:drug/metabolite transporter (DMT)-like permease